ncbi:MAG TPA: RNA-binding S4 domain-containing protein [Alphaproteobacteria bacterium]|nr:RNA-binding S4 domain-containing protein [Alphaproteobacteria bacterium]
MSETSVTQFESFKYPPRSEEPGQRSQEHSLRIDKWLWHCRFFKSRSGAARFVASGKVRVNRRPISKSAHALKQGDILTFVRQDAVLVIQVRALGARRGPPPEAKNLYLDLSDSAWQEAPEQLYATG